MKEYIDYVNPLNDIFSNSDNTCLLSFSFSFRFFFLNFTWFRENIFLELETNNPMSTSQVKYKPPNTFLLSEQIIFLRLKLKKKRSRHLIIIYAKSIYVST